MPQLKRLLPFLIIVSLLIILFFPMLLGKTLFFGDNYSLMVPGKLFTAYWLRQGMIPLWNPYLLGGVSWIGDINQSVLYPSSLVFALVHPAIALNVTVILHLLFSAIGMYLLAQRWLPRKKTQAYLLAVVWWLFSQKLIGSVNNLSILQSLSWMPWVVWAGLGLVSKNKASWKKQALFAAVAGMQLAGGYPQVWLLSVLLAGWLSIWQTQAERKKLRQWLISWLGAGVMTLGLSAVVWLPFWQLLSQSTRPIQSASQALIGSLHPLELLKSVVPFLFKQPTAGVKWGPNWNRAPSEVVYLGWLGLALAGRQLWLRAINRTINRTELMLVGTSIVFLLLALGGFLPGFSLLQAVFPVFRIVRNPGIMLIVPSLLLPLWLSPLAFSIKWQAGFWPRLWQVSWGLLALAVISLGISFGPFDQVWLLVDQILGSRLSASAFHTLARDQLIAQMVAQSLLVASGGLVASLWALKRRKYWLLIAVIGLDLVYHSSGSLFFAPATIYPSWPEINNQQTSVPVGPTHNSRYLIRNSNKPYTDFFTYWDALSVRQPFTDSFIDEHERQSYSLLAEMSRGLTPNWHMVYRVSAINGYLTLMPADVDRTWNRTDEVAINSLPEISLDEPQLVNWAVKRYLVDGEFAVEEDLTDRPILSTAGRWQTYQLLGDDRFRLQDGPRLGLIEVDQTPNQLAVRLSPTNIDAQVVVADRYDPGWLALVQGKPVLVTNHNGMLGFELPAETSLIVLTYQPNNFYWGLLISLLTGMGVVGWWVGSGWFRSLTKFSNR